MRRGLLCALLALAGWLATARDGAAQLSPGPLSAAHSALEGSTHCLECHRTGKGVDPALCLECHGALGARIGAGLGLHGGPGYEACERCHVEHQGRSVRPTEMNHLALAIAFAKGADGPTAEAVLGKPEAELERSLDCNRCHANEDPHREQFGTGCADCHGTSEWQIAGYLHPSPESRDCAQCHVAPPSHYMMHFEMVSEKTVGLEHVEVRYCYLCHQTTSWNDIRGVGWYKHH